MEEVTRCPECEVPVTFSQEELWLNNGDIVQRLTPEARMGFFECESLDPLFQNISNLIGVSIERMVVNIQSRATEAYMRKVISQEIRDLFVNKQLDPDYIVDSIIALCHIYGFGKYEFLGFRYQKDEDDYTKFRITKPFSVLLAAGAMAGSLSSVVEGQHRITYEQISPELYEFTTSWTEYPKELMERFEIIPYKHIDGDIELERCGTCGIPLALSDYGWLLKEGLIVHKRTGHRMALLRPGNLDLLFEELHKELGKTIPEVVVEAQRRSVRAGSHSIAKPSDEEDFRTQLALRGLGNLHEIKADPTGLFMRIDNAIGYLLTVGMVQGIFEMAFKVESNVEWELSDGGNLQVEVKPKA